MRDPERGSEVVLPLQLLKLWAPSKARWVWAGAVAKYLFWSRAHCSLPRPAAPRRCRSRRRTTQKMYSGAALSLTAMYLRRVRVNGRLLRGGRATADACLNRSYAACACGTKPRRGPAALPGGKQNHFKGVNRHKREVSDFACGTQSRREPPAALPRADVWRNARCDGAHCPCAARHAASDSISPQDL